MGNYRIVFAGTPDFAAAHLTALLDAGHDVVAVFTQPDRPAGRGKKLQASPVKRVAQSRGLPIRQPESLRSEEQQAQLAEFRPELLIVVAYGLILPPKVLDIPSRACINVHASLLPRWRGAAPIERALLAGDQVTGVTIMLMDEGLDTGDMLYRVEVAIDESDTREDLAEKLVGAGCQALLHSLENFETLLPKAEKQRETDANYAEKLHKSESLINWNQPAVQVNRQIRAGIGRVPAFTLLAGDRIRILRARPQAVQPVQPPGTIVACTSDSFVVACEDSTLLVDRVQLPGKSPVAVRDILNSRPDLFAPGQGFSGDSIVR